MTNERLIVQICWVGIGNMYFLCIEMVRSSAENWDASCDKGCETIQSKFKVFIITWHINYTYAYKIYVSPNMSDFQLAIMAWKITLQGWFYVCTQPMRDGVTL